MVPPWVPSIIRHLLFRVPKKGTNILTTTHMGISRVKSLAVWFRDYGPGFTHTCTSRSNGKNTFGCPLKAFLAPKLKIWMLVKTALTLVGTRVMLA